MDNMSRKSGFSNRLSLESPRVDSQRPYHRDPLFHCQSQIILIRTVFRPKGTEPDVHITTPCHMARIPCTTGDEGDEGSDPSSPSQLLDCSRRNAKVCARHSSAFAAAMW